MGMPLLNWELMYVDALTVSLTCGPKSLPLWVGPLWVGPLWVGGVAVAPLICFSLLSSQ